MPGPSVSSSVAPNEIRTKLERVLKDKDSLLRSAKISFEQFDKDKSGGLDIEETQKLIARLCKNLTLPPVDETTLQRVFARYDEGDGHLDMQEFAKLYWDLLLRIRDKYFPTKTVKVRRCFFVGRTALKDRKMSDIFTFEKKLGAGSFGQVYLVKEKSSKLVRVCKTINKDKAALPVEQIEAEIEFMKTLDHPNIIKIFDVYEDYHNIYIIMETCEGGELMDRVVQAQKAGKRLHEKYVAGIMLQMMEALAYFHGKKIAHKDLKPENVMFQDKSVGSPIKVIDFGVAEMFNRSDEKSVNAAGTALYMAPEVYKRCFGLKCDVWSAGCILYLLLTGRLPFMGTSIQEVQRKVCTSEPAYSTDCRSVSPQAMDLLKRMLQKDPRRRLSTADVIKHPWFANAPDEGGTLSPGVLDNMQKYMKQSGLKNALVNLITHQMNVNGCQVRNIIQLFRQLDKDGNGTLTHEELTEGLSKANWPQWDINRIVQSLDVDDSGNIAYTEFMAACYSWQDEEIDVIWSAFSKMDASGDGRISTKELANVLAGEDAKFGDKSDIERMVKQIDKDGDGSVDWDEFLAYMRG